MTVDVSDIRDWLIDGARTAGKPGHMMSELCERLVKAGIPLWRAGFFIRTLHPDIYGRNFIWKQGEGVTLGIVDFDMPDSPGFNASPLAIVFREHREVRCRVGDPQAQSFPIVEELAAEGVTDYLALPMLLIDDWAHGTSWTTKQPGGFTDAELNALRSIMSPLARLVEVIGLRRVAATLLDTYVGNRAGEKILGGQIRRGHTESMNAAIWLSDLRGFTSLSDRLPAKTVVDILNQYFDCQVAAIKNHGGEVLK